jgi:hypothetical protein
VLTVAVGCVGNTYVGTTLSWVVQSSTQERIGNS